MTSLNISLPAPLKQYVESRVSTGDYGTPSEYLRELIRRDKLGHLQHLELELLRAARSRDLELTSEDLEAGKLVSSLRRKLTPAKNAR